MEVKVPKEGSRKRQVFDAMQGNGYQAALGIAAQVEIKPGTVRSWVSGWIKAGLCKGELPKGKGNSGRPGDTSEAAVARRKNDVLGRKRFTCPTLERDGVILRDGPEVSEVRFDDDGSERFIPNELLHTKQQTPRVKRRVETP